MSSECECTKLQLSLGSLSMIITLDDLGWGHPDVACWAYTTSTGSQINLHASKIQNI